MPKTLQEDDRYARELLSQEQAFVARAARGKGKDEAPAKPPEDKSNADSSSRPAPDPNSKRSKMKAARAAADLADDETQGPSKPQCYNCGEIGHIKPNCPELGERTVHRMEPDKKNPFKPPGIPVAKSPSKKSVNTVRGREEETEEEDRDARRITTLLAERDVSNRMPWSEILPLNHRP